MRVDYLIIGSGLTGATIARLLADQGREVLVVERRSHLGGNAHDHLHESGIRIHTYGPHYFRTSSERIWQFVNRFAEFHEFAACLNSFVDGRFEQWPISESYIRKHFGEGWQPAFQGEPGNFEEAALALMPQAIYEKFVKGYTEKQWGVPASALSTELIRRFDVRADGDPRLKQDRYQGIPKAGYAEMMRRMLEGVPVRCGFDYLQRREEIQARKLLVFTGPIDEYFGFDLGRLKYRGQRRQHEYLPDVECYQPVVQVNNPDPARGAHIRTLEWKHLMPPERRQGIRGTVITRETTITPDDPNQYEYPFPDEANRALYQEYRRRAEGMPGLLVCGRLGEYRYYDMDQAIGRALTLAERILAVGE